MLDYPEIKAKRLNGQKWYEIDDIQDLDIAESIFTDNDGEKLRRIHARWGGLWRYPGLRDFCLLVNPFYPPQRLKDEITANFDTLISSYPSGNYINKSGMSELFSWAKENGIALLIDESFSDFADEPGCSLINQEILDANPNLYVVKSISKSCGVPGLRLGILASGDKEAISRMKKDIAIWNINSFAEFYMQIAEKYSGNYTRALELFRAERARFLRGLGEIPGVRPIPSQANYIMAEISGNIDSSELAEALLTRSNILIKNLRSKTGGSYVRLAVKSPEDNDALLEALREIIGG